MKKIVSIVFLLLIMPLSVSANILCNDGTTSPSCTDCHKGCCSHHGGCANSNSNSSTKNYNNNTQTESKKPTKKYDEPSNPKQNSDDTTTVEKEKTEEKSNNESTNTQNKNKTEEKTDEIQSTQSVFYDKTIESKEDNGDSNIGGITAIGTIGAIAYGIYKMKQ